MSAASLRTYVGWRARLWSKAYFALFGEPYTKRPAPGPEVVGGPRARKRARPGIETAEQRVALERLKSQMVDLEEVTLFLLCHSNLFQTPACTTLSETACAQALRTSSWRKTYPCQARPPDQSQTPRAQVIPWGAVRASWRSRRPAWRRALRKGCDGVPGVASRMQARI